MIDTLKAWHALMRSRDPQALQELLAEDVVFHSPVVHTPQRGRAITALYLTGALHTLNNAHFRYVREIAGDHEALLEFVTEIDGVHINGIDLIHWGPDGRIVDFKVMVRPLKAVNALHQAMGRMLQQLAPAAAGGSPVSASEMADFKAGALAQGFDEVLERVWAPNQVVGTHTHPFAVQALVVQGEMWLGCGGRTLHLRPGDRFELAREEPHDERYGPQGATYWAARRNSPA